MNEAPAYIEDTIVAAATPPGKGGIGIVRISGPGTEEIGKRVLGGLPKPRFATTTTFPCGRRRSNRLRHCIVFSDTRFIHRRIRTGAAGPRWPAGNVATD